MLDNRLTAQVEDTLEDSQYGFRKNKSIQDTIFVIRQLMEKTNFDKEMHLCFIDLEKAFDRVNRSDVFGLLRKREISDNLLNQNLHTLSLSSFICHHLCFTLQILLDTWK
jgi:hypothetical protein